MKKFSKILILALTVVLAVNALCVSAFAATIKPGYSGTMTYVVENVYGVDGTISVAGTNIFSAYSVSVVADGDGIAVASEDTLMCFGLDTEPDTYIVTVKYDVKADAKEGAEGKFVLNGTAITGVDKDGKQISTALKNVTIGAITASASGSETDPNALNYAPAKDALKAADTYLAGEKADALEK